MIFPLIMILFQDEHVGESAPIYSLAHKPETFEPS
jgi:hypothetical protein